MPTEKLIFGLSDSRKSKEWDIITLSDPIQVQEARIEGEIKGLEYFYEYAMVNDMQMRSLLLKKLNSLKEQLKALQDGN